MAPPDPVMLVNLLRQGEYRQLEETLSAYDLAFRGGQGSEGYLWSAYLAFQNSDPGLAAHFDDWIENSPSAIPLVARGMWRWSQGMHVRENKPSSKTEKANSRRMEAHFAAMEKDLKAAIGIDPGHSVSYGLLISAATFEGDRDLMVWAFREAKAQVPRATEPWRLFLHGIKPWFHGSYELMANVMEHLPDDKNFAYLKGYVDYTIAEGWRSRSEPAKALSFFDAALAAGERYYYYHGRGRMWEELGQDDKAFEDYEAALMLHPRFLTVYDRRGLILERRGNLEGAVAEWDIALKLDPFHPIIRRHRGNVLRRLGRLDEAVSDFEIALVHGNLDGWIHYGFGSLLLYNIKDYDRAARHLEKATALSPGKAAFWYHLGVAHYHRVDCQIIPVMRHYRSLCDSGNAQAKDCTDDKYDWSKGTEIFVEDGECPDPGN